MSEEEIISGLLNKSNEIFLQLVNEYKNKIISLCYSYTKDYQEAEDLSQEVFISLHNSIYKFRRECSLSTYIYRITVSRCLDYKRKRSIKGFLIGLLQSSKDVKLNYQHTNYEDTSYVAGCISKLPEELRVPVILYYYNGLSQSEIGSILKISQKAVEGRIYRAKQKLKIEFEREEWLLCRN